MIKIEYTFESIIKAIYDGYDILEIDSNNVVLTKYIVRLFKKYHINITHADIKKSFLDRLQDSTHQFWVKPYMKELLSDIIMNYDLPGTNFKEQSHYFSPDKQLSDFGPRDYKNNVFLLQNLYQDFKKGQYRYDFCVHDIIRSKQLYNAFHMYQEYLTPTRLDELIDLMYTDITSFENHRIIRLYLQLVSEQPEYYYNVLRGGFQTDTNYMDLFYFPGDPDKPDDPFDGLKKTTIVVEKQFEIPEPVTKHCVANVIMIQQDLDIQQMNQILITIKQRRWLIETLLTKQYRQFNINSLKTTYLLNQETVPSKVIIIENKSFDTFYMNGQETNYDGDTQRDYEKDQRAASLLYEIQTVCNKDPEPYCHLLYLMYGSDSDIIKIGRTMNGSDRVGLYEAPINQNDSHFYNDEVVFLLGFDYSYGDYKPYNNYKNGLTPGTAKFFAAEYMLKQMLYLYCKDSHYLEKFEKGKEWFQFKSDVSYQDKAMIVHLIRRLIHKANDVVEPASDDCMTVAEVKREIGYNETEDVRKWLNEVVYHVE